ncbi:MAG: YkgJ family cysteine cluster protein [Myxococcota bacterium]
MLTHATRPDPDLLRHACTGCGGCCQGVRVPVYNDSEAEKVRVAGRALGIEDPVDGGGLRMVDGHCAFLADDNGCRIHATLGPDAKPIPCRQFPLIAVSDGADVRVGIDPASYGAWRSYVDGDAAPDGPVVAAKLPAPDGQEGLERALVTLCEAPNTTSASLLSTLTRDVSVGGLVPAGFAERWAEHLGQLDVDAFLSRRGPGRRLIAALKPLAHSSQRWQESPPPASPIPDDLDRWVVEATRRVLWLRLLPEIPNVSVAAMLCLGGGLAASWTHDSTEDAHDLFTAWLRALRFEVFWKTLARDQSTVLWLATGQRSLP